MYTIGCTSSAQNHPKISCSEDRFLSFRSGIFSEIILTELGAILSGEQAQKPLANMYTIACGLSAFAHPKIFCSEDRFLSFRSGIFSEIILTELVAILSGAFARSRFANMYTIGCAVLRGPRNNIIRKPFALGCGKLRARRSRRRASRSYHFGSEFLTNSLSMRFTILGGFIQTIFISLPPCTH